MVRSGPFGRPLLCAHNDDAGRTEVFGLNATGFDGTKAEAKSVDAAKHSVHTTKEAHDRRQGLSKDTMASNVRGRS